ncbi:MAG TPA: hypothetical protein VHE37_13350 [Nevskiaceae bacterium]|nr:hypothetical protein [Nevskiaceae bacterium]
MSAPPVLVLGAPFSGAAPLARALGAHPSLYALPQLNLFMADRVSELIDMYALSQGAHGDGLLRAIAQLHWHGQTDATIGAARKFLAEHEHWSGAELLDDLAARAAPRRLLLADTESPLRPLDLRRIAALPGAVLIHVTRHPYAQGLMHEAWLRSRLFVPPDFKDHFHTPARIEPQLGWLRANRNLDQHVAAALRVRIEDCVGDAPALDDIGRLLDLPESAATGAGAFEGYGPTAAPYGLDDELVAEFATSLTEQAQRGTLVSIPPWIDAGFAAEVSALARRYGYR